MTLAARVPRAMRIDFVHEILAVTLSPVFGHVKDHLGFLEDADPAESVVSLLDELLAGFRPELPEVVAQRDAQMGRGLCPVAVGASRRLANDRIDRAQAQEVGAVTRMSCAASGALVASAQRMAAHPSGEITE